MTDLNVVVPEIIVSVTILPQLEKMLESTSILEEMVADHPWDEDAKEALELVRGAIEDGQVVHESHRTEP